MKWYPMESIFQRVPCHGLCSPIPRAPAWLHSQGLPHYMYSLFTGSSCCLFAWLQPTHHLHQTLSITFSRKPSNLPIRSNAPTDSLMVYPPPLPRTNHRGHLLQMMWKYFSPLLGYDYSGSKLNVLINQWKTFWGTLWEFELVATLFWTSFEQVFKFTSHLLLPRTLIQQ